ncbi:MAG: DUF5690 family protein [Pirellulaceae bacterium]
MAKELPDPKSAADGFWGIRDWLSDRPWWLSLWAMVAAFGTYFCMYGFRKPYTAGSFGGPGYWHWDEKTVLLVAQTLGYAVSKFVGIRVISEMTPERRPKALLGLILFAHLALLGFAVTPAPWHIPFLFLNGLPLGMVFGLGLGFLEGRRVTEALSAGLCASFILAGGISKSVGQLILDMGFTERWMPFLSGLVFLFPLFLFVAMLKCIPEPSEEDRVSRSERVPMTRADRWSFFQRYAIGLIAITTVYFLVTLMRAIRDDLAPELWRGLGAAASPTDFATTDLVVALTVLAICGLSIWIGDNRIALLASLGICLIGFLLLVATLVAQRTSPMAPQRYMILVGLGLYLPYVAIHTTVFERLIAATRDRGNIGFMMYLVDSIGYLGTVALLLGKPFLPDGGEVLPFFQRIGGWIAWLSIATLIVAIFYFQRLVIAPREPK